LTKTDGLTDLQRDILGAVREFVEAEIIPVAGELDRTAFLIEKQIGFGRPGPG
jgi:hypothetical protein